MRIRKMGVILEIKGIKLVQGYKENKCYWRDGLKTSQIFNNPDEAIKAMDNKTITWQGPYEISDMD